jgi:hypothetical protein
MLREKNWGEGVKNEKWSEFAEMARNLIENCFLNISEKLPKNVLMHVMHPLLVLMMSVWMPG